MKNSNFTEKVSGRNYRFASLLVITSSVIACGGAAWAVEVEALDSVPKIANVTFEPPTNEVPRRALGGGSRGEVGFTSPEDKAPSRTLGGGSRGEVGFSSPEDKAPSRTLGGGSRGEVGFSSSGDRAPSRTLGGGSRGEVGFSSSGDRAPSRTMGGGSRGEVGFSSSGDRAPSRTMGGGSRGEVGFTSPEDKAPSRTMAGGSRREQLVNPTPLIPSSNIGWTASERPTFFVYIPQTSYKQIFLSLYSEDRQYHYQTTFELNKTGGVIAIKVPQNAPALEVGKTYQWSVSFIGPEEMLLPDSYAVRGWVKRVPAPQTNGSMTPIELAVLYGKSGIWYDTLSILSSARLARPEDANFRQEWADLLEQVGLKDLAQQPLTQQL
ncbi:DUF928 domain-containing protein [Argonema antarcticum]|uniref:DUF928 domain-containing protein n=1 Tax=Argonema antarcticum TaxID=2942763 RepID=UPI002012B3D0|nr:DUF928 domain-containing protein [Argonema antarcticum]MCL1470677.1 DUF928 domain-containing protein [Argonema antarcticum A004/B2]